MTTITVAETKNSLSVAVRGHCDRDVCIAVSAITNTLAQYAEDFRDNNSGFCTDNVRTKYGSAQIIVHCNDRRLFRRFLTGAKAILTGYEIYSHFYPEEVYISCKCKTQGAE